jgi:hypothetical protein
LFTRFVFQRQQDLDKRAEQYDAAAAQELMDKAVQVVNAVKSMHAEHWPVLGSAAPSTDTELVEAALAKLDLEEKTEAAEADAVKKDSTSG